jgi:hypothetical protein
MIKEFCDRCNIEITIGNMRALEKVEFSAKEPHGTHAIVLCKKCYDTFNFVFMTNAFMDTSDLSKRIILSKKMAIYNNPMSEEI